MIVFLYKIDIIGNKFKYKKFELNNYNLIFFNSKCLI